MKERGVGNEERGKPYLGGGVEEVCVCEQGGCFQNLFCDAVSGLDTEDQLFWFYRFYGFPFLCHFRGRGDTKHLILEP